MKHTSLNKKGKHRCYAKSPTAQDTFWPTTGMSFLYSTESCIQYEMTKTNWHTYTYHFVPCSRQSDGDCFSGCNPASHGTDINLAVRRATALQLNGEVEKQNSSAVSLSI